MPQDNLPDLLKRMRAGGRVPVEAFDRAQKIKLATGALLTVDNQIDPATGTVKLKAQFPNDDNSLFPNQFVNARMLVDTLHGATIVPSAAVQRSAQGTFVYVVKGDKTVTLRKVSVGVAEGDNVTIDAGVAAGELVVVEGVDRLRDGAKVEIPGTGDHAAPAPAPAPGGDAAKSGRRRKNAQ
jgi:multidrug efflux system membrane fusion protein